MVPFKGIARKLVLPFIALTAMGWLLVVIGFGVGSNTSYYDYDYPYIWQYVAQPRNDPDSYPYWAVCLSGPFTLAAAVAHAALWKPFSPFVGAATTFLSVVFLTSLGMILFEGVYPPYVYYSDFDRSPSFYQLEFAGAFIATLFWIPVVILQHFYDGFKGPGEPQQLN